MEQKKEPVTELQKAKDQMQIAKSAAIWEAMTDVIRAHKVEIIKKTREKLAKLGYEVTDAEFEGKLP